jgi:replicative DNA helicase
MASSYSDARPLQPVSERDSLKKALYKMKARRSGELKSLLTAWPKFNDAFCNGLEWRTITVVGARPGTGKTLFMEQLVNDVIKANPDQTFRVLKFQFEMLDETNGIRKLSMNVGADYNTLMSKTQPVERSIFEKCVEFYEKSVDNDIIDVVYDPCTPEEMCATIHAYMAENRDEEGNFMNTLVTIDHSALFKIGRIYKDKFEMLYGLGEALTEMKKKFPVAFIVLSQLNRNVENPDRAKDGTYGNYILDSDLYGSDALLQHADVVIGINRPYGRRIKFYGPEKYIIKDEDLLVFHYLKSRNGLTGLSFYKLNRDIMRIVEVDPPPTSN